MSAVLALLSGLLLALTSPRPGLWPLAWAALAPLFAALLRARSARQGAALGLLAGLGFEGMALHWVYSTCRFAQVPVWAGLLAWASVAVVLSLPWALLGAGAVRLRSGLPSAAWPWACASLWAGIEFAASRFTPGLGLILLEYTQWRHPTLYQGAAWAGPQALGFLIIAWNAALAVWAASPTPEAVPRRVRIFYRPMSARARSLAAAGLLAAAWWGAGALSLSKAPPLLSGYASPRLTRAEGKIAVLLQPNIDQYKKWGGNYEADVRKDIESLVAKAGALGPDLVIWPESSVPGWLDDPRLSAWVSRQALRTRTPHLVGAMTDSSQVRRNSAVLYDARGRPAGRYDKRRLVPFGEFVPLRFMERFIGLLKEFGDLAPGPSDPDLLKTPLGPTAVTICYEAAFPALARRGAARGARVLVNLTNDGWYKETWGPSQHFLASRFRAVENRIHVLRAANTGISAAIDPWGRVTASLGLGCQGVVEAVLPLQDPFPRRSFYARTGDWFGWLCLAASACAMVLGGLWQRR